MGPGNARRSAAGFAVLMEGSPSELLIDQRVHQAYLGGGYTATPT